MRDQPTVLVLAGGPDAEHEVSLLSGAAVAEALRTSKSFRVIERIIDTVTANDLRASIAQESIDVVFPALHGQWGEGGPLQELLEEARVAYVGSRPAAAALAMHKLATKSLVAKSGVRTPEAVLVSAGDSLTLGPPLVLKPVNDGSSVDLRICRTEAEINLARRLLHPRRRELLAERYIVGRELTVGIICGEVLPIIEIVPGDDLEFYDYQAKYLRNDTQYLINPAVPASIAAQAAEWSLLTYRLTGARDIARIDLLFDLQGLWFLEINTMPGFTSHSLVPMAARSAGVEMPALCERLVMTAIDRGPSPTVQRASFRAAAV